MTQCHIFVARSAKLYGGMVFLVHRFNLRGVKKNHVEKL